MSLSISDVDTDNNNHPLKGQGGLKQTMCSLVKSPYSGCIQIIEKRYNMNRLYISIES